MHAITSMGHILIGLFFVFMGIYNLRGRAHLAEVLHARNWKIPEWLLVLAVALEAVSGLAILFNIWARVASIYLIAFTVVVSFLLHPFWTVKGREMWKHLIIIAYNVAVLGALLLVLSHC